MGGSDSDSESDLDFATLDLTGVDFDGSGEKHHDKEDAFALNIEMKFLAGNLTDPRDSDDQENSRGSRRLQEMSTMVADGRYVDALKSDTAEWLLCNTPSVADETSFWGRIRKQLSKITAISECVEAEFIAIAAFNLFLQLNYTGPTVDDQSTLRGVNPHSCFAEYLSASENDEKKDTITSKRDTQYHNTVLSELAVDGMWPCQVAEAPYLLLLARCILATLSDPNQDSWASKEMKAVTMAPDFVIMASKLSAASLWSARATVAHERLLLSREPTVALWNEIESSFPRCLLLFQEQDHQLRATLLLEYGLACYHFNQSERGKELFLQAKSMSGLSVEVTGVQGKRTKFQTKATAQMIVRATSASEKARADSQQSTKCNEQVKSQMVEHSDDTVLLDRVSFEDKEESKMDNLTILDQSILLALCLDVKSNNPSDGLTEEQSAYLARVLCHHDDWIVYSTALLERAWLEFEGNHTKERAILQMQALADQHTNRLTITQSTRQSVEDSSPVQDRVKNLHSIVYPPRWQMLRDVAERYAQLGIVTSAAEIFTEIECWDEVVDCYRRAGKEKRAEEIVRERLAVSETPRMWAALGDITNDPRHYEKAIKLSKGRFSQAYVSLGKYYFDKGDLSKAADAYRRALKLRPLIPSVWFRVGTISMQLGDWEGALTAFSEVVQQQPDEAEGWANVAAVHMHNKHPAGAYPALVESLKHNRNNWRVWISKLYTCLDLQKYDEATQACDILLDLRSSKSSHGIPELEEKCVRAIVGGILDRYRLAASQSDTAALDSSRRSLTRVHELLERIRASSNEPWVFETTAYFHEQIGQDMQVYENLMKEYRSLSSVHAWENDDRQVRRVCQVVSQIVHYQKDSKEKLMKSKFLLAGVLKRVKQSRIDKQHIPEELCNLETLLEEITRNLQEQI